MELGTLLSDYDRQVSEMHVLMVKTAALSALIPLLLGLFYLTWQVITRGHVRGGVDVRQTLLATGAAILVFIIGGAAVVGLMEKPELDAAHADVLETMHVGIRDNYGVLVPHEKIEEAWDAGNEDIIPLTGTTLNGDRPFKLRIDESENRLTLLAVDATPSLFKAAAE